MKILLLLAIFPLTLSAQIVSDDLLPKLDATVLEVYDGDTYGVAVCEAPVRVRLYGIDCPESNQPFGEEATAVAKERLKLGGKVELIVHDVDPYGRLICDVVLVRGTGLTMARWLLGKGLAWWYAKYSAGNTQYEEWESKAREEKRGLWSQSNPTPPWEWRKKKRNN